jgi:hypothetical protein
VTTRDYLVALAVFPTWLVVFHYLTDHAATSAPGYPVAGYLPAVGATGLTLVLVLVYLALRLERD